MIFKDSTGAEHNLKLTLGVVNRIKPKCDLLRLADSEMKLYRQLMSDPLLLSSVVFAIINRDDMTFEQFCERLDGDAIDSMIEAFNRAIADFSQPLRNIILKGMEKTKAMRTEMETKALSKIASLGIASSGDAVQKSVSTP